MSIENITQRWIVVLALAFGHYIALGVCVGIASSASYDYFDYGTMPTRTEKVVSRLADILAFPAYPISYRIGLRRLPLLHSLITAFSSLLWGIGLYLLLRMIIGLWHKGRQAPI